LLNTIFSEHHAYNRLHRFPLMLAFPRAGNDNAKRGISAIKNCVAFLLIINCCLVVTEFY